MIHNFNTDGFDSLYPKFKGGRPRTFNLLERREIKKIAKSKPTEHDLPFSTWSLTKLADFLVAEGVVDDVSHSGLRILLREEGVSFQRLKTWKTSRDPDYAAKKARVEHLYAIADGEVIPEPGDPEVVFCLNEFGPLNLMSHPGRSGPNAAASTRTGAAPGPSPTCISGTVPVAVPPGRPRRRHRCYRIIRPTSRSCGVHRGRPPAAGPAGVRSDGPDGRAQQHQQRPPEAQAAGRPRNPGRNRARTVHQAATAIARNSALTSTPTRGPWPNRPMLQAPSPRTARS